MAYSYQENNTRLHGEGMASHAPRTTLREPNMPRDLKGGGITGFKFEELGPTQHRVTQEGLIDENPTIAHPEQVYGAAMKSSLDALKPKESEATQAEVVPAAVPTLVVDLSE